MGYCLVPMRKERRCSSVKIGTEMGLILVNFFEKCILRGFCAVQLEVEFLGSV